MKKFLFAGIMLLGIACSPAEKGAIYWVNSYKVDCTGVGPMECLLIQKGDTRVEGEWQNFYAQIEGFDYEPGFIYKLRIKEEKVENVPADASSVKYKLIEVLEKKRDERLALNGTWDAYKIKGSVIKLPRTRGAGVIPQIEISIKEMSIGGINGCNDLHGNIISIKDNHIELGPIAVTNKMCPDMTIADSFNEAMNAVKKYQVEDGRLKLLAEDGSELLEFNKGVEAKVLINDIWVAETVDGTSVQGNVNAPRLEVHAKQMEVMGTDGCNNFTGKIKKLTNKELVFEPLALTKKACPDMTIPDQFNDALAQVRNYKITGLNLLLLNDLDKVIMVLKKAD